MSERSLVCAGNQFTGFGALLGPDKLFLCIESMPTFILSEHDGSLRVPGTTLSYASQTLSAGFLHSTNHERQTQFVEGRKAASSSSGGNMKSVIGPTQEVFACCLNE